MSKKSKFKSDAFEAIHSSVSAMHRLGTVDKVTMRHFDESCLIAPAPMDPAYIKQVREANKVSQPVFARCLNISESSVEKWETGAKQPRGAALTLLRIVDVHGLEILSAQTPKRTPAEGKIGRR